MAVMSDDVTLNSFAFLQTFQSKMRKTALTHAFVSTDGLRDTDPLWD